MTVTLEKQPKADIIRVRGQHLHFNDPHYQDFKELVQGEPAKERVNLALDFEGVTRVDSEVIGFLMNAYRQANAAHGEVKIFGLGKRLDIQLRMTGALHFIPAYPDEASAMAAFPEPVAAQV